MLRLAGKPANHSRIGSKADVVAATGQRPGAPWCAAGRKVAGWIPLLAALGTQTTFSLPAIAAGVPSAGERRELWVGQAELSHLLTGARVPAFQLHSAGVPVLYPLLDAIAHNIGGLGAARGMSLLFMLTATVLMWNLTTRLVGSRGAAVTIALCGSLAPDLSLSALASAGAASLCLLALAMWCVTRAGSRHDETGWMLAAAAALVLANATSYVSMVFDPVIVAIAIIAAWPAPGGKYAVMRGMSLLTYATTAVSLLLTADGSYEVGIRHTIVAMVAWHTPSPTTPTRAWTWAAAAASLAILAGYAATKLEEHRQVLLAVLLPGGLLVILAQAGIFRATDASTGIGIGASLAAMAVGQAVQAVIASVRFRRLRALFGVLCIILLLTPAALDAAHAYFARRHPASSTSTPSVRSLTPRSALAVSGSTGLAFHTTARPWVAAEHRGHRLFVPGGGLRRHETPARSSGGRQPVSIAVTGAQGGRQGRFGSAHHHRMEASQWSR